MYLFSSISDPNPIPNSRAAAHTSLISLLERSRVVKEFSYGVNYPTDMKGHDQLSFRGELP